MATVYIVRTHVRATHENEWRRWQDDEHIPNLVGLPGYRGVQRFAEFGHPGSYLNVWRINSRAAQGTEEYRRASLTAWFDRIRPHYDVEVDFGVEAGPDAADESAPWRVQVGALTVDRWDPESTATAGQADAVLDNAYVASLRRSPHCVATIQLDRLMTDGKIDPRASPSRVVLTYLRDDVDDAHLPSPPFGIERRTYQAVSGYRAGAGQPSG